MKKYSLYLFDFDGTLFDTCDSLKEAFKVSLNHYGKEVKEEEYSLFLTFSLPRTMKYKGVDLKYKDEFIKIFHDYGKTMEVAMKTKLYPDTLELFKYMDKHNIAYGIVTGSQKERAENVYKVNNLDFSKVKIFVGNESYKNPKPDPEPILIALEKTGFLNRKDEVVYIGDAEQDYLCAKAAGVDCIIINRDKKKGDILSLLDIFRKI